MHLRKVFKRIKKPRLYCKLKNCEFGKKSIMCLSHETKHGTIKVDLSFIGLDGLCQGGTATGTLGAHNVVLHY